MKCNRRIWFLLPMRCLMFLAAFSFCSMITGRHLTGLTHWWTVLASAINIATIAVLWMACKRDNATYPEMMRYKKGQGNIREGFLFVIIMLLAGIGGMYFAGWLCYGEFPYLAPMMIAPIPPYLAALNVFILPLTTTLAEDGIYLGYGVNSFTSKWAAVLLPAFFYALQHSFIPTIFDARFMIYRFLSFLPLTIWICFRYAKGSPVSYIMTGHWILNIATTIQIAVTSFYPEVYMVLIQQQE